MAYDDVIGVADLKIRSRRFARIAAEMEAGAVAPMMLTEFMHPRAEELVGLMPRWLGAAIAARPALMSRLDRWFSRGRHIQSTSLSGFLQLLAVASLRRFRRHLLRHAVEMQHLEDWLGEATGMINRNYALATGVLLARRLVKGYSDTHARGLSKFDRVLSSVPLLQNRDDAGAWMTRLIGAALKDEGGEALDGALRTLRSL
jgi:indolepyruvate ferredoxin oxidoreductase beta subunit